MNYLWNSWYSEMYKGLAIYIGAWCARAGQGRGEGDKALAGPEPGSKHDLGLARAHPSSRGGGGRGCIHIMPAHRNTRHNIIKILIRNIKTVEDEYLWEHTRDGVTSWQHLCPPRPLTWTISWRGKRNWEIGNQWRGLSWPAQTRSWLPMCWLSSQHLMLGLSLSLPPVPPPTSNLDNYV